MKSSAVCTLLPAALSFRRRWAAAALAPCSLPFLMNVAPSSASTEANRYWILAVSEGSPAKTRTAARKEDGRENREDLFHVKGTPDLRIAPHGVAKDRFR